MQVKSLGMPRPVKEPLPETLGFRVTEDDYEAIAQAMAKERRTESEVSRAFIGRGIAAYKRDGLLFEPEAEVGRARYKPTPVQNTAPERPRRTGGVQKKTGTGNR